MKNLRLFAVLPLLLFSLNLHSQDNGAILKACDEKLFPAAASYNMSVTSETETGKKSSSMLLGFKKGSSKNVLVYQLPKMKAGTVEMRRDNSIWIYFSTNGKTMKSAFQSLAIGDTVCYGDILSNDLSYDYDTVSSKTDGENIILELRPKPGREGYAKLLLTIDQKTFIPKKKEYFALSGMLLKVCEITDVKFDANGRATGFVQQFYDPLKNKKSFVAVKNIKEVKVDEIPEKYFNETQLKFMSQM